MLTHDAFARLCRARDMLRETHDRTLTIEEVARDAALSPFHFIRQFRAMFGETPHQFRIQARLDRARRLLALSDYSVTDVCMEVGFTSLGSFSDLFARRVGVAPSVYRRQVRSVMPAPGVLPGELTPGCLTLMGAAFAIFEKQQNARLSDSDHEDQAHQHHGG
jgi:AraC-like DNA-binding protein